LCSRALCELRGPSAVWLVMGTRCSGPRAGARWPWVWGVLWDVLSTSTDYPVFSTTIHLVHEDTEVMNEADTSMVMGQERVREQWAQLQYTHGILMIPKSEISIDLGFPPSFKSISERSFRDGSLEELCCATSTAEYRIRTVWINTTL